MGDLILRPFFNGYLVTTIYRKINRSDRSDRIKRNPMSIGDHCQVICTNFIGNITI